MARKSFGIRPEIQERLKEALERVKSHNGESESTQPESALAAAVDSITGDPNIASNPQTNPDEQPISTLSSVDSTAQNPDEVPDVRFDKIKHKAFINKLETDLSNKIGGELPPELREAIEQMSNPDYIVSMRASIEAHLKTVSPENAQILKNTLQSLEAINNRIGRATPEEHQAWLEEAEQGNFSVNNPYSKLTTLDANTDAVKQIEGFMRAAKPQVTLLPEKLRPKGLTDAQWATVSGVAGVISVLGTGVGAMAITDAGMREFLPDFYNSIDSVARGITSSPIKLNAGTISWLTGMGASGLLYWGLIHKPRKALAKTAEKYSTGEHQVQIIGSMIKNPMTAAFFATGIVLSGQGALRGGVESTAKAQIVAEASDAAQGKLGGEFSEPTKRSTESIQTFEKDWKTYLTLMIKQEGGELSVEEKTESDRLSKIGWKFPAVKKSYPGPIYKNQARYVLSEDIAIKPPPDSKTTQTTYDRTAEEIANRVEAKIKTGQLSKDKLPLRDKSLQTIQEVGVATLSKLALDELNELEESLKPSAIGKVVNAGLLFLGIKTVNLAAKQKDLEILGSRFDATAEASAKLKNETMPDIRATFRALVGTIKESGGVVPELGIVLPEIPIADEAFRAKLKSTLEELKTLFPPDEKASLLPSDKTWEKSLAFLGMENTKENIYLIMGLGTVFWGIIDFYLAILETKSKGRRKKFYDENVPDEVAKVDQMEAEVTEQVEEYINRVCVPFIEKITGSADVNRIDAGFIRHKIRERAQKEVPSLAKFDEWLKNTPEGSPEFLRELSTNQNQMAGDYGVWGQNFLAEFRKNPLALSGLVGDVYPEYKMVLEHLAAERQPDMTEEARAADIAKLRAELTSTNGSEVAKQIQPLMDSLLAEEVAKRQLRTDIGPEADEPKDVFLQQLKSGLMIPLQSGTDNKITMLSEHGPAILHAQFIAEKQSAKKRKLMTLYRSADRQTRTKLKNWITENGDIEVPEEQIVDFQQRANNPGSRESVYINNVHRERTYELAGTYEEFEPEKFTAQLNYLREHAATTIANDIAQHPELGAYKTDLTYGVDPETGRPTVLVLLYDPRINDQRLQSLAFPGRVPSANRTPEELNEYLEEWYNQVARNTLQMSVLTYEWGVDTTEALEQVKNQLDFVGNEFKLAGTYDNAQLHELVQYTLNNERLKMYRQRLRKDMIYNPITEAELATLEGMPITIRGHRPFEADSLALVFNEAQQKLDQQKYPSLEISYRVDTRAIVLSDPSSGVSAAVPVTEFRNIEQLTGKFKPVELKTT